MPGVNAFSENVNRYEAWFQDHPLAYVSELHAIKALLPKGRGVEIGIGTGRFAAPLGIAQGVEPSRPMADLARKKGLEVVHGVAEHLPYADSEFDFCLMVTTVCFLDDMDMSFNEAFRIIRPGGALLVAFVDRESALGREYAERKDGSVFYKDATFYSTNEIISRMTRAGFSEFARCQTLFGPLDDLAEVEQVKEGSGEGSFVVVRGSRPQ